MNNKRIYALTDQHVEVLKAWAEYGLSISTDHNERGETADASHALTPLDRDAAVEWMAEAMIAESPYSDFITEDEREWYMLDARAALDALLGGEK